MAAPTPSLFGDGQSTPSSWKSPPVPPRKEKEEPPKEPEEAVYDLPRRAPRPPPPNEMYAVLLTILPDQPPVTKQALNDLKHQIGGWGEVRYGFTFDQMMCGSTSVRWVGPNPLLAQQQLHQAVLNFVALGRSLGRTYAAVQNHAFQQNWWNIYSSAQMHPDFLVAMAWIDGPSDLGILNV
jgi:hypothetical protein